MSKSKAPVMIGVIAVVAIIASAGIGFAIYNGNTYSENNTMAVSVDRVDILKNSGSNNYVLLDKKITMPEYSAGSYVEITGYAVATSSNSGSVAICCNMIDPVNQKGSSAYWALISSMYVSMDDNGDNIPFGKVVNTGDTGDPSVPFITGVPSDTISMDSATEYTLGGKTYYYRTFTIKITFSNLDITNDKNYERLSSFEGSSFSFEYFPA